MTILEPKVSVALKNAKLPAGMSKYVVPGAKLPQTSIHRILHWLKVAGHPETEKFYASSPDCLNGWFSISETVEYGRTLWQPYIAQHPDSPKDAALITGFTATRLNDLSGWSVTADEDSGLAIEWEIQKETDDLPADYVSVPVRIQKDTKVSLKELRASIKSDVSGLLAEPVIYYPKLPSLPVGSYKVVGTFIYKGYNGPAHGLTIDFGNFTQNFQGNPTTEEVLSLKPDISPDNPATLHVLSLGITKQGHPMARVSLEVSFSDLDEDFDFAADFEVQENKAIASGEDDLVLDLEEEDEIVNFSASTPSPEPEVQEPKKTRKRSR